MFRFIILHCIVVVIANVPSHRVQISSGEIEGQYIKSKVISKSFYSFRGIPFAEPPIGKLRFQPPVKIKCWTKTLETKTDGAQCVQRNGGSEDCLFINVYTPELPSNVKEEKLLPVMVYIYGGGFISGSADSNRYGPDYLIDKNVVLVTINYRLNIFGFLNAMEESAPGNAGLKDQVLALEWVKENIEKFNGDPNKVTIFGQSAGSASVQYLVQSKLAKGLFHRAIMQSGSTLTNWALEFNPIDLIHKLAKVLNIKSNNVTEIINLFQNFSSEELFNASNDETLLDDKHRIVRTRFIPSLEHVSSNAFMTENSYSLLQKNKINSVPIMIGHNSKEALLFVDAIKSGKMNLKEFEDEPTLLVPKAMNINNDTCRLKTVWNKIKNHYFKNVSVTNIPAFINYGSDEMPVRSIIKSIQFLRKRNDIYFYIFDYNDKINETEYTGVAHNGELKYIFYNGAQESEENKTVREKMATLWTNFAKTGNPTPNEDAALDNVTWPKVLKSTNEKIDYLYINKKLLNKVNPYNNYEFWEKIFNNYGKAPFFIY